MAFWSNIVFCWLSIRTVIEVCAINVMVLMIFFILKENIRHFDVKECWFDGKL